MKDLKTAINFAHSAEYGSRLNRSYIREKFLFFKPTP
jgi:hypothetical protein